MKELKTTTSILSLLLTKTDRVLDWSRVADSFGFLSACLHVKQQLHFSQAPLLLLNSEGMKEITGTPLLEQAVHLLPEGSSINTWCVGKPDKPTIAGEVLHDKSCVRTDWKKRWIYFNTGGRTGRQRKRNCQNIGQHEFHWVAWAKIKRIISSERLQFVTIIINNLESCCFVTFELYSIRKTVWQEKEI